VSLEPELPPTIPEAPSLEGSLAADATAAQASDPHARPGGGHGHHGPFHSHCENCGAKLDGPWCHACGQHDFEFHRSFRHVAMEALESFFHFDGTFFRTTRTLLFQPGRLTALFNGGKRASQMPPFRLYVFVAFVFFLVMHFAGPDETGERIEGGMDGFVAGAATGMGDEVNRAIWTELSRGFSPSDWSDEDKREMLLQRVQEQAALIEKRIADATPEGGTLTPEEKKQIALAALRESRAAAGDGTPPADATTSDAPSEEGEEVEDDTTPPWLERLVERLSDPAHRRAVVDKFYGSIPKVLLICMPIFALMTRVLFRRNTQVVYLQHLVLALHYHTFIYLWTLLVMAVGWVVALPGWGLEHAVEIAGDLWMLVYPAWMLRRLFGDGWGKTILKTILLAGSYGFLLLTAFAAAAVIVLAF